MDLIIKTVVPVAALVIGFFLKEIETRIGTRRAMRRATNRALAELINLHEILATHRNFVDEHKGKGSLSPATELRIGRSLANLLENSGEAIQSYDNAIIEVAGENPVLGSELRALHRKFWQVRSIIDRLDSRDAVSEDMMNSVDAALRSLQQDVRDRVFYLAGRLDRRTVEATRKHLARSSMAGADDSEKTVEFRNGAHSLPSSGED
jgi:hypothetical protein